VFVFCGLLPVVCAVSGPGTVTADPRFLTPRFRGRRPPRRRRNSHAFLVDLVLGMAAGMAAGPWLVVARLLGPLRQDPLLWSKGPQRPPR
jgi:hypothetical protein